MRVDDIVVGVLLGVALGIHYAAGLAAYLPLIVLFLVIGGLRIVTGKK